MAEAAESITRKIPGGKKRRGATAAGPLSKSMPSNFWSKHNPPPTPRFRPMKRTEKEPEGLKDFKLPPPSPLDDNKLLENSQFGRSLTKTTPEQLLYPSSLPSRFAANTQRLKDLSLTPKKPDIIDDNEASPSSSVQSNREDTEHDASQVGSFTLYQILENERFNSNEKASVLTDAHKADDDDAEEFHRTDGIFELEDD